MGLLPVKTITKWRTTPVVEEVFAEVSAQVAAVGAVDAAEAVVGAAVPGVESLRTRSGCQSPSWVALLRT